MTKEKIKEVIDKLYYKKKAITFDEFITLKSLLGNINSFIIEGVLPTHSMRTITSTGYTGSANFHPNCKNTKK